MVVIKDVMNKNVETVKPDSTIYAAAELMSSKGISCLIISEDEKVSGIVTRRDILEKVIVQRKNPDEIKVSEIMTAPVITVNEEATLIYAAGIMNYRKIKQIPVVSQEKVAGIVTQTDIVLNINTILGFDKKNLTQA